ncbi:import component protein [Chryseobacterium populi]|uniref:import component protein n=1 Tax=Chryseobacterium populi TaxID=1144316 RepID=UPI0002ED0138|nr:import component protein [Chryseobacterium populi]
MNNKNLSIISYITLIGWLIAYFSGKEKADSLLKYHLRQSLGLMIVSIAFNIIIRILISITPALAFLGMAGLLILVFWVLGIINAANGAEKPVPLFGKMFEDKFAFIG